MMNNEATPELYRAVFEKDRSGTKVLEDLTQRFFDISSYTQGDPYHTAYREGQRAVLKYVLRKLGQQTPTEEEDDI